MEQPSFLQTSLTTHQVIQLYILKRLRDIALLESWSMCQENSLTTSQILGGESKRKKLERGRRIRGCVERGMGWIAYPHEGVIVIVSMVTNLDRCTRTGTVKA